MRGTVMDFLRGFELQTSEEKLKKQVWYICTEQYICIIWIWETRQNIFESIKKHYLAECKHWCPDKLEENF